MERKSIMVEYFFCGLHDDLRMMIGCDASRGSKQVDCMGRKFMYRAHVLRFIPFMCCPSSIENQYFSIPPEKLYYTYGMGAGSGVGPPMK